MQERVNDSDSDLTDEDKPPKKKSKQVREDTLQSRKLTKKLNKKAEKDSPAGTDIITII